ncbi:sodium-dependent transporter bedraggled [Bacillus rossius redtenbacheri]|uniref:sodium-dependent transporter bedraggled n=1 Tax=Bacillus rossius redtenbacheri TaxID=93214 RepID=UPI002FDE0AE3
MEPPRSFQRAVSLAEPRRSRCSFTAGAQTTPCACEDPEDALTAGWLFADDEAGPAQLVHDGGDEEVRRRLAELAGALAGSLAAEDPGCRDNPGFDGAAGLDMTDPRCDHLPWRAEPHQSSAEGRPRSAELELVRGQAGRASLGDRPSSVPAPLARGGLRSSLAGGAALRRLAHRLSWASRRRSSGSSWTAEDEEVDWSWVQDELQLIHADPGDPGDPGEQEEPLPAPPPPPPPPPAEMQPAPQPEVAQPPPPQEAATTAAESWVRASMRRVRRFALGDPPAAARVRSAPPGALPPLPPLGPPAPQPSPARRQPAPPPAEAFPRRFSAQAERRHVTLAPDPPTSAASSAASSESSGDETHSPAHSVRSARSCGRDPDMSGESRSPLGDWPHNLSSMLASLGCTLGLCNICRFSVLSIHYGANFILQFLFMTLIFGIPLYCFQASLGQYLAAGVMDMWRISPVFQGIGIALLISQFLIGIYSIVGVSWMFIYFRDSFITKLDRYRWAEPYDLYREDNRPLNGTYKLEETVPDYLNGVVLQRHSLTTPESTFGHLKFQVTFNLAVVWMIVFVCLSKGLKSYGKVVYVFSLLPIFGMLILCTKILGLTPVSPLHQIFPETEWSEFFLNTKSWVAATTEAFLTWGLLGASLMQISSHNRNKHLLNRDTSLVVVLTLTVLLLSAFLANTCVQLLKAGGYVYTPSSFELMASYGFLRPAHSAVPTHYSSTPVRFMQQSQLVVGTRIVQPASDTAQQSGYQVLRLATELVPAALALLGTDQVSPFWAVLFYFTLILFGIAQQLCIWHCVITGITAINVETLKAWDTTITFFSCACGFVLGLPMTTELGIFVVYFLDLCVGSAWWVMVLYLLQLAAVLVVRGRPYSGDVLVTALLPGVTSCLAVWASPMLVFNWNVLQPIALMVLCITVFKNGQLGALYVWRDAGHDYWPPWAREAGSFIQLLPLLAMPLVGVVQGFRYLSDGPPDIFDRIALLCRPSPSSAATQEEIQISAAAAPVTSAPSAGHAVTSVESTVPDDPPPKYTPPPSYSTATGARIAKMLRQSIRRSMRRLATALGEHSESLRPAPAVSPPDYAAVLVEINQALQDRDAARSADGGGVGGAGRADERMSTMCAADVAHVLRSSMRRPPQGSPRPPREDAKVASTSEM